MSNKCKITILLFIISITNIYNYSFFKPIPLSNDVILIIKQNGIYFFNENKTKEKYIFENGNEKLSSKNELENIYYFKNSEEQNKIFIFIKRNIYIFSSKGNFIKKCNYIKEIPQDNYLILPYKYKNDEESNKYYYILINIDNKNIIVINYYEYNYIINKSNLLFKKEFYLPNFSNENSNNNFSFQLIKDKDNNYLLALFYISNIKKDLSFEIFEFNIDKKEIKIVNWKKPKITAKIEGSKIKSINNKDNTKTLICSKNKKNINCLYYDSIKNTFSKYTNYLNNCEQNMDSFSIVNHDNINNNYVLYCISSKKKINYVELNDEFHYKNLKIIDNNNKIFFNENKDEILNYKSLISHILNNYPFFMVEVINEISHIKNLRKLNGGGEGSNPSQGDGDPSQQSNNLNSNGNENEQNSSDKNNGKGNTNGNSNGQESKGNGQTKEGFSFDFDNKETNIPKGQIKDNRDDIMNNVKPGETYELKGEGYEVKVSPMGQKEEGSTSIDFLSCEQKLREYYELDESSILTVFQIETEKSSEKSLTNRVQYIVYDENIIFTKIKHLLTPNSS